LVCGQLLALANEKIEVLEKQARDLADFVETTRKQTGLQSDKKIEALEQKARELADFVEALRNQTRLQSEKEIEALRQKARDLAASMETDYEKTVAMNEALVLGSVRQHELTATAEKLNEQLQAEITERKQAERAAASLASIVESSDDAIISKDLNGVITSWNKGAERLFGYTADEAIGQSITMLIPPNRFNEEPDILERIRRGESIEHYETVRHRKDGTLLDLSLTVSPLRNNHGQIVGASKIARDITERKQTEEALRKAQAQLTDRAGQLQGLVLERTSELSATNNQLEAFIYSIAHDLRAPLRSMQGFSAMLMEDTGTVLSEVGRDFANRINKSAQFMDALLKDLLIFSSVAQQRIELTSVSLETVVESVLSRLKMEIQEKNARVEIAGLWPTVWAHEPTLGQVLANLVSNALKFVRTDTPPLIRLYAEERIDGSMDKGVSEPSSTDPTIRRSSHPAPGFVRLWVEDNGIGIADEYQEQIFRLFMRLHGEKFPGTGIGLAIVQKGIERMGGQAGVESTPDKGSRFWFELQKAGKKPALL
jgi:PAS domain S-box-containing protein